jgi:hypothetical protein
LGERLEVIGGDITMRNELMKKRALINEQIYRILHSEGLQRKNNKLYR